MSSQTHGLRELKSPWDPEAKALMPCGASPAQLLLTEGVLHLVCVSSPALLVCVRERDEALACSSCCYFELFAVSDQLIPI